MGMALCPKHGQQGIASYCTHLAQVMAMDQRATWTLVGDKYMSYWLCASCVQRFLADPVNRDTVTFAEHQDITGWCGACFGEWKTQGLMIVEPLTG